MLIRVALKSLLNRRGSVLLTIFSVAISLLVLMSVDHIRQEARKSFGRSVSGVDLIVGARTGQLNLLLYSVFGMGNPGNNVAMDSMTTIASRKDVAWAIPISIGDSLEGYRVIGTTSAYFEHFRYGSKQALFFAQGNAFGDDDEVVLGAAVAKALGYKLGDEIVLSHGTAKISFHKHKHHPFQVTGILAATGTPVDQSLMVPLHGIDAMHAGMQQGFGQHNAEPESEQITAFMLGLTSKVAALQLQQQINNYTAEPLTAILPGVALGELWQMLGVVEQTLTLISILVLFASLLGLSTMLLASMQQRQRELAVIRAIGGHPSFIFWLIQLEVLFIVLSAMLVSMLSLWLVLWGLQDWLTERFGLYISLQFLTSELAYTLLFVLGSAVVLGLIPALKAYSNSLGQGLIQRN